MAAINHDRQQNTVGTSGIDQGVKGRPDGTTGEQHVVNKHDGLTSQV